jgi:hypothetical protein
VGLEQKMRGTRGGVLSGFQGFPKEFVAVRRETVEDVARDYDLTPEVIEEAVVYERAA